MNTHLNGINMNISHGKEILLNGFITRDNNLNKDAKKAPTEEYMWIAIYWEMYEMILYLKKNIGEGDDFSINSEKNLPLNIDASRHKFPRNIDRFKELMRTILDKSILPCLLGYIYLKAETPRLGSVTGPEAPFLENLLDMPLKQAEKTFAKHYYDYNLEKYPDPKTFKKEVGIAKKSLAQRFTRPQKNE